MIDIVQIQQIYNIANKEFLNLSTKKKSSRIFIFMHSQCHLYYNIIDVNINTCDYKSCNIAIRFKAVPDRAFCIVEYLLSPTAKFSSYALSNGVCRSSIFLD